MAQRTTMEAGPPALIEAVVRLLVPPVAREHVLGDLAERYSSPARYASDALRTIPFVVASRIRRTTNPVALPLVAVFLMSAFAAGSSPDAWVRAAIPTAATIVGFMLRDAYRAGNVGIGDVAVAALFALASQAVLAGVRPEWLISPTGAGTGTIALVVLHLLRRQNPTGVVPPFRPAYAPTLSLGDLRQEIQRYERESRRAARIEIVIGRVLIVIFSLALLFADGVLVKVGSALSAAGTLFVVWFLGRETAPPPLPIHESFSETMRVYRARLEHHHHRLKTVWWWYFLPLAVGPMIILIGPALGSARPVRAAVPALAGFLATWLFGGWINARAAHGVRHRIESLEGTTERK